MPRILYAGSRADDTDKLCQSPDFAHISEHAAHKNAKRQITGVLICKPPGMRKFWKARILGWGI
jgi:hypothetical protein